MKYLTLTLLALLAFCSCQDRITYAAQLKAEQRLIKEYIERSNIKVVSSKPQTLADWGDNVYWKTSSGLYFHLVEVGDTASHDSIAASDLVITRFVKVTLTANPDTVINEWSTAAGSIYLYEFRYLDLSSEWSCEAWHEAVSYMKFNEARARLIVHSKIGFKDDETSVTPYYYDIRIKIKK